MKVTSPAALANTIHNQRILGQSTLREIADIVGMKQTTVSDFELKPEPTKLTTLFEILAVLNLELDVSKRDAELTDGSNNKREWQSLITRIFFRRRPHFSAHVQSVELLMF